VKVLVTAATRHHGTFEIAEAIASGLAERGIDAEALPIGEVTSLDRYCAVVLGSAVYMGRWLGEARRFAQLHASALCVMPVWLFSSRDDRDWDAIDRFAGEIADELLGTHVMSRATT
jgi:menaquinone-dependent protoporphyrinogen oxidase